jgi:hypothetical protein
LEDAGTFPLTQKHDQGSQNFPANQQQALDEGEEEIQEHEKRISAERNAKEKEEAQQQPATESSFKLQKHKNEEWAAASCEETAQWDNASNSTHADQSWQTPQRPPHAGPEGFGPQQKAETKSNIEGHFAKARSIFERISDEEADATRICNSPQKQNPGQRQNSPTTFSTHEKETCVCGHPLYIACNHAGADIFDECFNLSSTLNKAQASAGGHMATVNELLQARDAQLEAVSLKKARGGVALEKAREEMAKETAIATGEMRAGIIASSRTSMPPPPDAVTSTAITPPPPRTQIRNRTHNVSLRTATRHTTMQAVRNTSHARQREETRQPL